MTVAPEKYSSGENNKNKNTDNFISNSHTSAQPSFEDIFITPKETGYKCPECSKDYSGKANARGSLTHHLKTHSKKAIFVDSCPECGKEFKNRHLYNKHKETHKK